MKAAFYSGKVCVQISKFQDMFSMQLIDHTLWGNTLQWWKVWQMKNTYIVGSNSNWRGKKREENSLICSSNRSRREGLHVKQLRQLLGRCLSERHADKLCLARLRTGVSEHFADERECFGAQRADGRSGSENSAKSSNLAPV